MDIHAKLAAHGLTMPPAPKPAASYLPGLIHDRVLWVSGQLPLKAGRLTAIGPAPEPVLLDDAKAAAGLCALNALAVIDATIDGDWSRFERVLRLGVFVASAPGFDGQHLVANGASDLLAAVLGEAGRHVRAAVGVAALPMGATVEIELAAAVR